MTIDADKIAKLELELQRYKRKAKNRRQAIKDLIRSAKMWQTIAQKYMAQFDYANARAIENHQVAYFIAKKRAIEVGLITEADTKHISGVKVIRGWLDAREAEYKIEKGIV